MLMKSPETKDKRPLQKCAFCNEDTSKGMSFHAQENSAWKYLVPGQVAHAECYIHKCVEESYKNISKKISTEGN